MKYQCISEHLHNYPVVVLCRVLEVAPSGYYAWKKRQPSLRQQADERLEVAISQAFLQGRSVYRSPRIHAILQRQGIRWGRKRVVRLLQHLGLAAVIRKRKPRTTDSVHDHLIVPHILNREFTTDAPNQRWVGDITVVDTPEGWLYVPALLDLYSRRCVGWAMSAHPDEALVTAAFQMAYRQRIPTNSLLHHTDRGSQHTSQGYRHLLATTGIHVSMSRRANDWDNAAVESFWRTLKTERANRSQFASRQQACTTIFAFLEIFYNRQRLHSPLGYLSPSKFEHLSRTP